MEIVMCCTACGSRYYSSAAEQMLDDGATCDCGSALTAAPLAESMAPSPPEGRAADENSRR